MKHLRAPRHHLAVIATLGCASLVAVAGAIPAWDTHSQSAASNPEQPRKLALLVGINEYRFDVPNLDGCVNDVSAMRDVLMSERYGFAKNDIMTLVDQEATRAGILAAFRDHLIAKATADAIVVFHFSGHGSTLDNPADPSGKDNTIVPHDSRDPEKKVTDIRDKELNVLLRQLAAKTKNVAVILDSCFSGTGTRGAGKVRSAPPDTRFGATPPPPETFGGTSRSRDAASPSGFSDRDINYVLVAAARADQEARETVKNSRAIGALTYHFIQEILAPTAASRSYRDIMNLVVGRVRGEFPSQTPQLEGQGADQVVFGSETLPRHAYIAARSKGGREVELDAGELHGMTAGSEFDVYGPEAHRFAPPEKPIARIKLTTVHPLNSDGTAMSGGPLPEGAKAIERLHNHTPNPTVIAYDTLGKSKALQVIKAALDRREGKPIQTAEAGKPFLLRLQDDNGQVVLFGPDGRALGAPIPATDPELVAKMETRIMQRVRWFGVLALHNTAGEAPKVGFALQPKGRPTPLAPGEVGAFTPGSDRFALTIANPGSERLFVYILDLTSTGSVTQVYPDPGSTAIVDPGRTSTISGWSVDLGNPPSSSVRDVFKLIATTKEVDLRILEQDAARGPTGRRPSDALSNLLVDAATGTRHASRLVDAQWTTAQVAFDVCPRVDAGGRCR